jgi:SAM-dependent methyltransferase
VTEPLYDDIGRSYAATRGEDPRIAARIHAALGDARSVVNVGAGTGSYEPRDREVVAVEPSAVMRAQRPPGAAPCVDARAESLPFADGAFDAAMGVLTLHHWDDWHAGCAEMRRVAPRQVLLSWDPSLADRMWIGPEYFPDLFVDDVARFAPLDEQVEALGAHTVEVVRIPHDCADGFLSAYWRRPEAYLDPTVRRGISTFSLRTEEQLRAGLQRLAEDVASGAWHERHADLLALDELDLGYRLLVAGD